MNETTNIYIYIYFDPAKKKNPVKILIILILDFLVFEKWIDFFFGFTCEKKNYRRRVIHFLFEAMYIRSQLATFHNSLVSWMKCIHPQSNDSMFLFFFRVNRSALYTVLTDGKLMKCVSIHKRKAVKRIKKNEEKRNYPFIIASHAS